jgi:hypothetical protein
MIAKEWNVSLQDAVDRAAFTIALIATGIAWLAFFDAAGAIWAWVTDRRREIRGRGKLTP